MRRARLSIRARLAVIPACRSAAAARAITQLRSELTRASVSRRVACCSIDSTDSSKCGGAKNILPLLGGLLAFVALAIVSVATSGSARASSTIFKLLVYFLQTAEMTAIRTLPLSAFLTSLFNFEPPATSDGLCPFAMTPEDKLLWLWSLPLLAIAAFLLLAIVGRVCCFCTRSSANANKGAAQSFAALLLFLFGALSSSTMALLQVCAERW